MRSAHEAPAAPPRLRERIAVPFDLPGWVVAPVEHPHLQHRLPPPAPHDRRAASSIPQPFFHPLDFLRHWNRLYGRRGFAQYQCVLPFSSDGRSVQRFFEVLTRLGGASPVSVLKNCGPEGRGVLSFPMPGISVALDLPFRRGHTQALVDALNEVVIEAGGRIYLTKDALTRPEHLRAMEPRLPRFQEIRRKWDPERRLRSALSVRLLGDSRVKVVLLGATRGMGRALARLLAARGERLFLLGRDAEALARSARDLELRGAPAPVGCAPCDLLEPAGFERRARRGRPRARRLRHADRLRGPVRHAGGARVRRDRGAPRCSPPTSRTPCSLCEAARVRLLARGGGTLCVFSSVAGDRARKPVVLYGAAKAGLSALPRGPRPPLPRAGPAHAVREARLRAHRHDRGARGAALRGRSRRGRRARAARARPRRRPWSTRRRSGAP